MFFTRIAIAALTFGSFAQVFAAPIAKDLGAVIPESLPVERRTVDYTTAVANTKTILDNVKAQLALAPIDPTNVKPEIIDGLAQVAPALASVSSTFKALGAEEIAQLSAESVAADITLITISVNDILTSVKGLKSVQSIVQIVINVKDELDTVVKVVINVLPVVFGLIKTVLVLVNGTLATILPILTGTITELTTGGL